MRLIHAYHLLRGAVLAAIDLIVFIFATTSFVFVLTFDEKAAKAGYIDALHFTVATLATTGFGDITLATPNGKLLSVFNMVAGVALFVRAIFQPSQVKYKCTQCGLSGHDTGAIHCKHCGESLTIETEGYDGS